MNAVSFAQLWPCQPGEVLAKQAPCHALLKQLRALISAPSNTYAELYLPTLYRFMELCQALPYTASSQPPTALEPYSLIQRAFSLAVGVLQCRRGQMMPSHSDSEQIAAQEPLWTYALLTIALFYAIPAHWQTAYTVALYKNEQERLGIWHPLMGSLYEPNTFYRLENHELPPPPVDVSSLMAAWVGRIIPAVALRWFADSPAVFAVWWEAISHRALSAEHHSLIKEINAVAEKLGMVLIDPIKVQPSLEPAVQITPETVVKAAPDSSPSVIPAPPLVKINSPPSSSPPSPAKQALIRLNQWLEAQGPESGQKFFMRVEKGLLIYEEGLYRMMAQYSHYASLEALITFLAEFLVRHQECCLVRYRAVNVQTREIRQGIVLAEIHLKDWLRALPRCADFALDYSSTT